MIGSVFAGTGPAFDQCGGGPVGRPAGYLLSVRSPVALFVVHGIGGAARRGLTARFFSSNFFRLTDVGSSVGSGPQTQMAFSGGLASCFAWFARSVVRWLARRPACLPARS